MAAGAGLAVGAVLGGRWRVTRPLAEGGGGTVFRGEEAATGRAAALKVFPSIHTSAEDFRREAAVAMRARHPNLVALYDAGIEGENAWLAMELVEGEEARARIESDSLPKPLAVSVAIQVFAALDALHRAGLAHGDIKPENVLLHHHRAMVVDFGRGRLRHLDDGRGVFPGTPPYMHPSLYGGGVPNARTDCFATWITLYEMACGERPWTSGALRAARDGLPPRRPLPDASLDALVDAGLSGRLPDARAAWLALVRWKRGHVDLPVAVPPPEPPAAGEVEALLARLRAGRSATLVGDPELGRATLEAVHRAWAARGGHVLWTRADWGSPAEPLSGALALAGHAADDLDGAALARIAEALGPLAGSLSAMLPAVRAWLGAPGPAGERRPEAERLAVALRRLLTACPAPLLLLVDGLGSLDGASRRFLAQVVLSGEAVALASAAPDQPHGMPEVVALPVVEPVAMARPVLTAEVAEVLGRARALELPFGPRLARATGLPIAAVEDAALEAEAAGVARWTGAEVVPRPGALPPPRVVTAWFRDAAAHLDPDADALLVARYARLGGDPTRLAEVMDRAVVEALRLDPGAALELCAEDPRAQTPPRLLRHLQVAIQARAMETAERLVAQIRNDRAFPDADRWEAEGEFLFRKGENQPAIEAFGRAARALGRPVRYGLVGRVLDLVIAARVALRRTPPARPDARLARILEHLYDVHFCSDQGPLLRVHTLWLQAAPEHPRARATEVIWRTALGMHDAADELSAQLLDQLREGEDPTGAAIVVLHRAIARLWRGHTLDAFADSLDAAERLVRVADPYYGALAWGTVAVAGYHLAVPTQLERLGDGLAGLVDATGDRRARAWLSGGRAVAAWQRGETELAWEECARWATDAARRGDSTGMLAERYLGELSLERGHLDDAAAHLAEAMSQLRRYHVQMDFCEATVLAQLVVDARLRIAGRPGLSGRGASTRRARRLVERSPRWAARLGVGEAWQAVAEGHRERGASLFAWAARRARDGGQLHDAWYALRQHAIALGDQAAHAAADALAAEAGFKGAGEGPAREGRRGA